MLICIYQFPPAGLKTVMSVLPSPSEPFITENKKGALTVSLMYNRTRREIILLFEEKRFVSPERLESLSLTRREAEIMFWITQGKSDDVIARLCDISPRHGS